MKKLSEFLCLLCGIANREKREAYLQGVKMGYWISEHKDSFSDIDLEKYGLKR